MEDSVKRTRKPKSAFGPSGSSRERRVSLQGPSTLIYHLSGRFVSEVGTGEINYVNHALPHSPAVQNNSTSRRFFSVLAQSVPQPSSPNSQQHHNHHGVVRLFLVISAFFLCWTPYICVALVQATETAISGQSSLVPPSAVTFSYWLVLLNSDINPLLYALLSKRFQGALQGLRQKLMARLGSVGRRGEVGAEGVDGKSGDPFTLTTTPPRPTSSSETSTCDDAKCPSVIFTGATDFKRNSEDHLSNEYHYENTSPSQSVWQYTGGDKRLDSLQVPCWPHEGSRLPFSALTRKRQATFFFGQITVRVEHDVC